MTARFASRLALAVTFAAALGIGLVTLTPVPAAAPPGGDKLHHILAFAALVLPGAALRPRWALWLCLFGLAYGGVIELVQPWAGRSRELADWLADGLGAIAGAVAGRALGQFLPPVRRPG